MRNCKSILTFLMILSLILLLPQFLNSQNNEDNDDEDEDNDSSEFNIDEEFSEVYQEIEVGDIKTEDLTLLEQIQLGNYDSVLDKYIKQLKARQSTPAYKSDASYAISQILYLEDDEDPVDELIIALNDSDPLGENNYIRRYAALALGYIDDPKVIRPLINAMKFKYLEISKENQIEPDYEKSNRTNQAIFKSRVEEDLYVRLYACYSLGKLGANDAAREMVNILKKDDEPTILRRQAALSLGMILNPNVYNNIADELKDLSQDKLVIKNIIWTLGQYGKMGYNDNSVLRTLLSIVYNDRLEIVSEAYITLENLLNTGNNDETDIIIDEIIDALNLAISNDIYKDYLNLMYNPRSNIDITEIIEQFKIGLVEIKDAVTSSNLLRDINVFLKEIENPDNFTFPNRIILIEKYDDIMNQLKEMKLRLDSIEISSTRRDILIQLFSNANKALNLLSDNQNAKKQAEIYKKAQEALERFVVLKEGEISLIEPVGYLTDLRNRYNKAINAMYDFYYDYARREAVISIGKIYQHTFEVYKNIQRTLERIINNMTLSLRSIMTDRNSIYKSINNLEGELYLNYFTEMSENVGSLSNIIDTYFYTTDEVIDTLSNLVNNYYTDNIHSPKEVLADKIEERTVYSKEYSYSKEQIRKLYTEENIKQSISRQEIIESYNGNSSFTEFLSNRFTNYQSLDEVSQDERENQVLVIFTKGDDEEEIKETVGIIINEDIIENPDEEQTIDLEGDKIIVEQYRRGTTEILIKDIQDIIWYRIPSELINKNVRVSDIEDNLFIGLIDSVIYDETGKKIVVENNSGVIYEIYLENIKFIYNYDLLNEILNKKVIINYNTENEEETETIGNIINIDIDEFGKKAIVQVPSRNIDVYLYRINGIVIINSVENLIGKKVIIKLKSSYTISEDGNNTGDHYYVYGILVDEQIDRIIIKTVDFDGDVYNISQYFKPIFLTKIEEILIDYSIPDLLKLGVKSIEMSGIWNKLKYQKDSIMERFDSSYQDLRNLIDPKREFQDISKVIENAIVSLKYYEDNSKIATEYRETLEEMLYSINNISEYVEENAQTLLNMKNYIRDNVYEAEFEESIIKGDVNGEDDDQMVSALNNILFDAFQNDRDKYVRLNCIASLIDIEYENHVSDMVNTLKNPSEPPELRAFVFNILRTYGFPAYIEFSKEDLEKEKYRSIKMKLEEMYEALNNFQQTIYEISSGTMEIPKVYEDPNFVKNHYLRVLAILTLGEFPTGESINLLIQLVQTYYPYKSWHPNYNIIHKRLTNQLREYALTTLVNKDNLDRGFIRNIEVILFKLIRDTEETLDIRTKAAKGVGKLAKKAREISEETGRRVILRPELIDALIVSLVTPNSEFRSAIVWSLGELGAERAIPYLRSLILQDYIDLEVKKSCLFALYKIRTEEAIKIIKNALYSKEDELEDLARNLLEKLGIR